MPTPGRWETPFSRSVFVGRQHEVGVLKEALNRARAGEPRVVLIEGAAGIGKTALVDRFLTEAGDDVRVLRASGDVSEADLPFGVLDQLLRRGGDTEPGVHTDDGGDHVALGARLLEVLGRLQDQGAVVVILDDAHWADASSLRAVLFVVRRLVADRVLVVVATRDDAAALPEGLIKAASEPDRLRLRLRPLATDELRDLAKACGVQLSASAIQRLEAHTGGNPLYTRALLDELPPEAWHRQDNLPAPRSFAEIVAGRVGACSAAAVRLIEAVAVLGPHCPVAVAASLGEVDAPLEALEEAGAAGLLRWDQTPGVPTLSFPHPLTAAAVYGGIGPAQRGRLHAAAAALVQDEAASLRHVAAAAVGPDEALALRLETFAERKADEHSLEVAALHMVTASRLSPARADHEERLLRAVDWMLVAGDAAQARVFAQQIAAFSEGPRRSSILGQLASLDGDLDVAEQRLTEAWEQCDENADPVLAAMIAHRNAYHALRLRRDDEVVTWARRALQLAPHDVLAVGWAGTLALSLWRRGDSDQAFEVLESARTGDEGVDLELRGMRGWLRFVGDDIDGARADLEAAAAGELRHGALLVSSIHLTVLARLQYAVGDWADAVVTAEQALALVSEAEHPHAAFVWWAALAVPAARGDWSAAETYARLAAAESVDRTDRTVALGMSLALVAHARGDNEAMLKALAPIAERSPNPALDEPGFWSWQDLYAEALVGVGRTTDADVFLRPHEALAEERGRLSPIAKLARVRGRLEATLGRGDRAAAAFARAIESIEPLGMPYDEALIRLAHGQFLRRNGQRRAAAEQLTRARDTLAELDARPALERCEREIGACGLKPTKRSASERVDLTPQEQAVARLVVTGRSNRDVAAELLLSVKTVEVHLTRIYSKLGISSRGQLAANPYMSAEKNRGSMGAPGIPQL